MAPKVSVVIPVYNAAEYLGQCLDTVLLQTLQEIEVICVDDGSTDDSLSCLQGYAFLDNRLKVIHQENAGVGTARNRGLKEATGEYVIFLNAEDFFETEMLEKMLTRAEENGADMVVCGHSVFDQHSKKVTAKNTIEKQFLMHPVWTPDELAEKLFICCNPEPWNRLIRSEVIKKNALQFVEQAHTDDIIFPCLVMACAKKIALMEDLLVYRRPDTRVQQTNTQQKFVTDTLTPLIHLFDRLKKLDLMDACRVAYLVRVRYSLQLAIMDMPASQKREALRSIRSTFPAEIYDQIFSCSAPAISLIIPAYNMARYLPECLDSALHQTLENIEIICVDDGSTDDTLDVFNQYAGQDKRIKVIHQENSGQAVARNTATEQATGQFIQFLDADDYLEPDTCECVYTYMLLFGLEMCQVAAIEFDDQTRKEFENGYHTVSWLPQNFMPVFNYHNLLSCLGQVAVTAWMTIYRRNFLIRKEINWIHKKLFYEDTPFFIEALLKAERMGALSDKFYHRRVHASAITQNIKTNFKDYTEIIKYTLAHIKKWNNEEKVFLTYTYTLLTKAWLNFGALSPEYQEIQAPKMYDLALHIVKKYHYLLPADITAWCLKYAKSKNKKKWLKLKFYLFLAKMNRPNYTINLIQVIRKPEWCIKIFGLPFFQVIRSPMQIDPEDLPLQKKVKKCEEIFYKICGLTFLKVEKKDLYG